jgi:integrase
MQSKAHDPRTLQKKTERFEAIVFPYLGAKPIASITAADFLAVLKKIEARGKHETAHRVRSESGNVFRYAVVTDRAPRDPTVDLRVAIAAVVRKNRAAIVEPARIGELLRRHPGVSGGSFHGARVAPTAADFCPPWRVAGGALERIRL